MVGDWKGESVCVCVSVLGQEVQGLNSWCLPKGECGRNAVEEKAWQDKGKGQKAPKPPRMVVAGNQVERRLTRRGVFRVGCCGTAGYTATWDTRI